MSFDYIQSAKPSSPTAGQRWIELDADNNVIDLWFIENTETYWVNMTAEKAVIPHANHQSGTDFSSKISTRNCDGVIATYVEHDWNFTSPSFSASEYGEVTFGIEARPQSASGIDLLVVRFDDGTNGRAWDVNAVYEDPVNTTHPFDQYFAKTVANIFSSNMAETGNAYVGAYTSSILIYHRAKTA